MKNRISFYNFANTACGKTLIREAKIEKAFTGEKKQKQPFNKEIDFSKQSEAMLNGRWPGLSQILAAQIMRFSKNWKPEIGVCAVELEFKTDAERAFFDNIGAAFGGIKAERLGNAGGVSLSMTFPGKKQGILMGALKANYPEGMTVKFKNGKLDGEFKSLLAAANVFIVASAVAAGAVPKKGEKLGIIGDMADFPADLADAFDAAVKKEEANDARARLVGNIDDMLNLIAEYGKVSENGRDAESKVKLIGNDTLVTYDMVWLVDQMSEQKQAYGENRFDIVKKLRDIRFGAIYRKYLNSLYDEVTGEAYAEDKRPVQLRADAALSETSFNDMLKANEKEFKELVRKDRPAINPNKAATRRLKLFEDAEYYGAQIVKANGWIAAICRTYDQVHTFGRGKPKVIEGTNEIDPDCNLRDDEIEQKFAGDPEKIEALKKKRDGNGEWVKDGICRDYDRQPMEGGWCAAGGNTAFRGTSTTAWGPGLKPISNWTTGVYFNCKKGTDRMPLIVYLEYKTGKLYCSNCSTYRGFGYSIGNGWYQYDFNTELNNENDGGIEVKMRKDQNFLDIYKRANILSWKGYMNTYTGKMSEDIFDPPDPNTLVRAQSDGDDEAELDISDNGIVTFNSRDQAFACMETIKRPYIQAIRLDFADASGLFKSQDIRNLRQIDCTNVTDASHMFEDATLYGGNRDDKLDLVSTSKCVNMSSMFEGAKNMQVIGGLDTSNAVRIKRMMANVESQKQRKIVMPTLNLAKCEDLEGAFMNSPIENLAFENADNVKFPQEVISGCYMLKNFPNLFFDVKNVTLRAFGVKKVEDIYSGCTVLQKREDFDEMVAEMKEYYVDGPSKLDTNKLGYAIVRTKDDIVHYMNDPMKYRRGVVLQPKDGDATLMFNNIGIGINPININVLDMADVKIADSLFLEARFSHLGKIINTEGIKSADFMFARTDLKETPMIDLTYTTSAYGIFKGCYQLRSFGFEANPNTVFGQLVSKNGDINDKTDPFQYIFCLPDRDMREAIERMGGDRVKNQWLAKAFENEEINKAVSWCADRVKDGVLTVYDYTEIATYFRVKDQFKDKIPAVVMIRPRRDASLNRMFFGIDIDLRGLPIDCDGKTEAISMFEKAVVKNIGKLINTKGIADTSSMFHSANIEGDVDMDDCGGITNGIKMFYKTVIKGRILNVDFRNLQSGNGMFFACRDEYFEGGLKFENFKMPNLKDGRSMFENCVGVEAENIDFQHVISLERMFAGAVFKNTAVCCVTAPKCTNLSFMFGKSSLAEIAGVYAPAAKWAKYVFFECENLELVGDLHMPALDYAEYAFCDCKKLAFVSDPDIRPGCKSDGMFEKSGLEDLFGKDGEFLKALLMAQND